MKSIVTVAIIAILTSTVALAAPKSQPCESTKTCPADKAEHPKTKK